MRREKKTETRAPRLRGPVRRAMDILSWIAALLIVCFLVKKGIDAYAGYRRAETARTEIMEEAERTIDGLRARVGELEEAASIRSVTFVTREDVREKLDEIGELAVGAFTYSGKHVVTNVRQFLGTDIPGTENRVELIYDGVIKVGYDLEQIRCSVNDIDMVLTIALPPPRVLDNYVILDTLECRESNSILNPLSYENASAWFSAIEEEELRRAEESGLYEAAGERIRKIITAYLSAFSDYSVEFRDGDTPRDPGA